MMNKRTTFSVVALAITMLIGGSQLQAAKQEKLSTLWERSNSTRTTGEYVDGLLEISRRMNQQTADPREKLEFTKYLYTNKFIAYNTINSALAHLALRILVNELILQNVLSYESGVLVAGEDARLLPENPRRFFIDFVIDNGINYAVLRPNVLMPELEKALVTMNADDNVKGYIELISKEAETAPTEEEMSESRSRASSRAGSEEGSESGATLSVVSAPAGLRAAPARPTARRAASATGDIRLPAMADEEGYASEREGGAAGYMTEEENAESVRAGSTSRRSMRRVTPAATGDDEISEAGESDVE